MSKTKKERKPRQVRETQVGFFTTDRLREALEAEAKRMNRSLSRHLHAILAERYPEEAKA